MKHTVFCITLIFLMCEGCSKRPHRAELAGELGRHWAFYQRHQNHLPPPTAAGVCTLKSAYENLEELDKKLEQSKALNPPLTEEDILPFTHERLQAARRNVTILYVQSLLDGFRTPDTFENCRGTVFHRETFARLLKGIFSQRVELNPVDFGITKAEQHELNLQNEEKAGP